jgi:hypothetical protein
MNKSGLNTTGSATMALRVLRSADLVEAASTSTSKTYSEAISFPRSSAGVPVAERRVEDLMSFCAIPSHWKMFTLVANRKWWLTSP